VLKGAWSRLLTVTLDIFLYPFCVHKKKNNNTYNGLVWCCVLDNDVSSDNALSSNADDDAQAETVADEDPRNKRFLFNLRGGAGGGSGNFLFDLIRVSVIIYIYASLFFHHIMTCVRCLLFLFSNFVTEFQKHDQLLYIIIASNIRPKTKKCLLPIYT